MASFPGFCRPGRVAEPRSSSINRLWVRHPPARPPVTPEVELPRRVSPLDHRGRWRRRWTEDPPGEVVAHQAGGQWIGLALAGRWCEDWGSWRRDLRGRAWGAWRLGSCAVILAECHATHITAVLVYKSGQNEADV